MKTFRLFIAMGPQVPRTRFPLNLERCGLKPGCAEDREALLARSQARDCGPEQERP